MGLFDFFKKDKGKEVFQENADANERAEAIRREIKRLGLPGDITVEVEGSRVKVGGNVPDDATRQKLAMIVGNVKHIDSVDDSALAGGQQGQPQPKTYEVQRGDTLSSIAKSEYGDRIEFRLGTATKIIPALNETFDLVFIDADKENYSNYYHLVFDKLRGGGCIIADNTLWSGKVLQAESGEEVDPDTRALHEFNQMVLQDKRVANVLLPIRDGLMIVRKEK